MFGQDRGELRRMYRDAWRKQHGGEALSPLESQVARVIGDHPEYVEAIEGDIDRDFAVEAGNANPFLHMGLHLALREQLATDRPAGIRPVFALLCERLGDAHQAEHRMIDCLAEALWEARSDNRMPDEQAYLERLRRL